MCSLTLQVGCIVPDTEDFASKPFEELWATRTRSSGCLGKGSPHQPGGCGGPWKVFMISTRALWAAERRKEKGRNFPLKPIAARITDGVNDIPGKT